MGRRRDPAPADLQVVHLAGVDYYVDWEELTLGASFFLPTVATAAQVRQTLKPVERALDIRLAVRTRVEYGRYGSRVWRVG